MTFKNKGILSYDMLNLLRLNIDTAELKILKHLNLDFSLVNGIRIRVCKTFLKVTREY